MHRALPEVPTGSGDAQPVAEASCCVMVKSIDMPWCDDVAAGLKFFECVANRVRFVNQFKRLQAGDLFVVLRTRDAKRVTAVAQVQSRQLERQTDRTWWRKCHGLQEPPSLNGPGFLTDSKEGRNAWLKFLHGCGCAVRYTHATRGTRLQRRGQH